MYQAVTYQQEGHSVSLVVFGNLFECGGSELNCRSFAFNDHGRLPGLAGNYDIGPETHPVPREFGFYLYQGGRITLVPDQIMDQILPDPFFWGKNNPFPSDDIKKVFSVTPKSHLNLS